jgi:hypothetical protein
MNTYQENKQNKASNGSLALLALSSLILGSSALWFTWIRYDRLLNQPGTYWYNWVQLAGIALLGILCLCAAILFILGKSSGRSVFKVGLSIIPILLFANLMNLVFRNIQSIFRGNTTFFFERMFAQPYKLLLILAVVIALAVLGSLNEKDENKGR